MRILDKARLRLRSLFRRPNVDFELEAELRFHLDQFVEERDASDHALLMRCAARRASSGGGQIHQLIGFWIVEGPQQHSMHDRENGSVCSDPKRQRSDDNSCEPWTLR